ncbi:DMT family transporter [Bacteroides sp. 224]|uniref:DMT family transporter n=1 Tax=Bacteroides sp. 224 TaxID=2302936 RepID=UPI0013D48C9E|nr:DMT family transporter [Bacteroides sp. 224]NDV65947.1 DMT family transporter [Bacteroides sp. 224]
MRIKLLAILACVLWGSAFAGAKIGFEYTSPLHLSGMRFMLAGILLVPFLIYQKVDWRKNLKEWRYMLLFGLLQTFIQYGLFFMGLNDVPGAISAIIIGGGPLFVAIMAHLTIKDDKLTTRKSFAITLGLIGIAFISISKGQAEAGSADFKFYTGVALLIISNIVGASTNIILAKNKGRVSPVMLTAVANFSGGLLLYIVSFFTEDWYIKDYTTEFYLAWIWLAFIPAAGFSIWYSLLQRPEIKVSELNIWKFVIPVTGAILSWMLLPNESPDFYSIVGIIIITTALIVLQWNPRKRNR